MKYVWRVQTLERRVVAKCLEEMKTKSKGQILVSMTAIMNIVFPLCQSADLPWSSTLARTMGNTVIRVFSKHHLILSNPGFPGAIDGARMSILTAEGEDPIDLSVPWCFFCRS